jgi:hypothetical protein
MQERNREFARVPGASLEIDERFVKKFRSRTSARRASDSSIWRDKFAAARTGKNENAISPLMRTNGAGNPRRVSPDPWAIRACKTIESVPHLPRGPRLMLD